MSRKPSVVMSPRRLPFPSRTALVATVLPCAIVRTVWGGASAASSTPSMPAKKPSERSAGVVGALTNVRRCVAVSSNTTSVNVPPMSIASRYPSATVIPALLCHASRRRVKSISTRRPRIEGVAHSIAEHVEPENRQEDRQTGEGGVPPPVRHELTTGIHHRTPFRRGRLRSNANETQPGRGEDGESDVHRDFDDQRSQRIGQDVPEDDSPLSRSHDFRCFNVGLLAQGQHLALGQPAEPGPPDEREGNGGVDQPWAERGANCQGQHDSGNGEKDIGRPHDELVDEATGKSGDRAEWNTDEKGKRNDGKSDRQRISRAEDHPGKDIAAEIVRAEKMSGRRRQERILRVHCPRGIFGIRDDDWSKQCCQNEENHEAQSGNGHAVLCKADGLPPDITRSRGGDNCEWRRSRRSIDGYHGLCPVLIDR